MINTAGLLSSDRITRGQLFSFFEKIRKSQKSAQINCSAVGLLAFLEPSTRTKMSFEKAGLDLGIRWMDLSAKDSSLEKGESQQETFKTLALYQPDFFVVRHSSAGFSHLVHSWTALPVINAGDGQRDHPSQGLLDAFTLWNRNRSKKWKIAFFGDVARSRVARADIHLFHQLGYHISVVDDGQETTRLFAKAFRIRVISRQELKSVGVVICLRAQKERGSQTVLAPLSKSDLKPAQLVMHPGPVMLGEDMAYELCDFSQTQLLVHEQVANGLLVRKQLLRDLLEDIQQRSRA
jgi:aspartate carbamoyltransferase catalytic subunit